MDITNVMVEFIVIGDGLIPSEITERLKLKPNKYWQKGDEIQGKKIRRKDSCWILNTDYEESQNINDQLFKIVKILSSKREILKELNANNYFEYIFSIVVNIENNNKPEMYFNKDFIKFIHDIGAEFYIDLYINS